MSPIGNITDDMLQDLIDGRLDTAERARLLSELENDPARMREVVEAVEINNRLRDMADSALYEDVPDRLLSVIRDARLADEEEQSGSTPVDDEATYRRWPVLASFVAGAIGVAIGWMVATYDLPGNDQIDLALGEATSAFSFYLQDPDYPIDFGYDRINEFLPRTESALGRPVDPPDLSESGFSLAGGRVIPGPRGNAIMYLYERGEGDSLEKMAVYVWKPGEHERNAPGAPPSSGVRTANWQSDGLNYTMLGGENQPDFDDIELNLRSLFDNMGMSHDTSS